MSNLLKKILVQTETGQVEKQIDGAIVLASNGESFEAHATSATRHVPAAAVDDKLLFSKNGAAPVWGDKSAILADAALTGTPTAPTAAAGTNTTQVATTAFVSTAVNNAIAVADVMSFQGSVAAANELPTLPNVKNGHSYKATAAFTLSGVNIEVGDLIVAHVSGDPATLAWEVFQGNIDGAVTGPASSVNEEVPVFNGTTGKIIKASGIGKADVQKAVGVGNALDSNKTELAKIGEDVNGHVTYDGDIISGIRVVNTVAEATSANAPVGTMFFVVETSSAA